MKVLIISHKHHLLPFAWRLKSEGCEVDVIIDRDSYERAWSGRFKPLFQTGKSKSEKRSTKGKEAVRRVVEQEESFVLTDSHPWLEVFEGYGKFFSFIERPEHAVRLPPYLLGAWFDGEELGGRHFLVEDQGLWPGGLGPNLIGGLTLVAPRKWPEVFETALQRVKDELKARSYRGLVKVGLQIDPEEPDEPILVGYEAGWNFLQAHAFLADAGDEGTPGLAQILQGAEPQFSKRYTMVLPMSVPPYPHRVATAKASEDIVIPSAAVKSGKFYWHDMATVDGTVQTANLDGLVGVVKGSADSFRLVNNRLLTYGRLLDLPQLQVRTDVGNQVEFWLAVLEDRGMAI